MCIHGLLGVNFISDLVLGYLQSKEVCYMSRATNFNVNILLALLWKQYVKKYAKWGLCDSLNLICIWLRVVAYDVKFEPNLHWVIALLKEKKIDV
jgi:hypothetical protein